MKMQTLESFPPNQNPFHYDAYHMGTYLGGSGKDTSVCIMFAAHKENNYIIVIDCVTGQRIRLDFDREIEK